MDGKVLLFEYGTLMHDKDPPKTEESWRQAEIYGKLHDVGKYKGVTDVGETKERVSGEVARIDESELDDLDERENVKGGEYKRVRTRTIEGDSVYVYEYTGDKVKKAEAPMEDLDKAKYVSPEQQKINRAKAHDASYPAYTDEPDGPRIKPYSGPEMHEITDSKIHHEYAKEYKKNNKHVSEAHAALAEHFQGDKPLDQLSIKRHKMTLKAHYGKLTKSEELDKITNYNTDMDNLDKTWPREYDRVKGQDKDKGVASKRQYRYMQAMAAEGDKDAKDYVANSPKGGDGLPDSGTGGARGEREGKKKDKKDKKDDVKKDETEKADANPGEFSVIDYIKNKNKPKVVGFQEQVADVKRRFGEKKPKTFQQQVSDVKARYSKPLDKCSELFYAKVEGLLEKGYKNEELLSNLMDAELAVRSAGDDASLNDIHTCANRLFDQAMSQEEQTVYELSHLARLGDEDAADGLEKFVVEMYDELVKNTPIADLVSELIKSNYGPKGAGLYDPKANVGRKARRTGEVHEDVGQNKAEYKFTPSVHGTMAEQASREAKRDQAKSKKNPVKVFTAEEKAALAAKYAEDAKKGKDTPDTVVKAVDKKTEDAMGAKVEKEHLDTLKRIMKALDIDPNSDKGKKVLAEAPSWISDDHHDEIDDYYTRLKQMEESAKRGKETTEKTEDNSKVVGKNNGESVRMCHGYKRYTSGPRRGEYVHRHEAEKRLGRKLGSKEEVHHKNGNRAGTKSTKVEAKGKHTADTNKERANGKGYSGDHRYEHTGSH